MKIIIDIGGTHFRIISGIYQNKIQHDIKSKNNLFDLISCEITQCKPKESDKIIIALPGIVSDNKLYECNNLPFLNHIILPDKILNIKTKYINDGDLSLIGEMNYNNICPDKIIMNLIFGTGVGCGIWCNGDLVKNSEVVNIFEKYNMGGKNFNKDNINTIRKKFINDLEKLIEIINIDTLIINGFIKDYEEIKITKNDLQLRKFYKDKLKIIYSSCIEPVLYGGRYIDF